MDFGKVWDKYGMLIAMGFMMLVMWAYTVEWLRASVGQGIDSVLAPLVNSFGIPFYILIVILSAFTGLYSSTIQKYTIDYDKMTETQERMKEFQTEYREAQLSQDEKKIKKLEARKDRVMKEQMEMSQQQFKPMIYIMVLTIPIFFWLLYRLAQTNSTITMPYFGTHALTNPIIWIVPAWILWYMICSITISQVIRKALNIGGL
ncbi:MAG: EMC3/TMCO1 family protein [Methanoregula sp.]